MTKIIVFRMKDGELIMYRKFCFFFLRFPFILFRQIKLKYFLFYSNDKKICSLSSMSQCSLGVLIEISPFNFPMNLVFHHVFELISRYDLSLQLHKSDSGPKMGKFCIILITNRPTLVIKEKKSLLSNAYIHTAFD